MYVYNFSEDYVRGLALSNKDAGDGEGECRRHHLLGGGPKLELELRLGGDLTGVVPHVDGATRQHFTPALLVRLERGERNS